MRELIAFTVRPDVIVYVLAVIVLAVISSLFISIRFLIGKRINPVEDRMKRTVAGDSFPPIPASARHRDTRGVGRKVMRGIGMLARPTDDIGMGRLRARLVHAGYRGERAVINYLAIKIIMALAFLGAVIWFNLTRPQEIEHFAFLVGVAVLIGYYSPAIWLSQRIGNRQKELNRSLPDSLDLLVTCVESGLGLDAAITRVGNEIALSAPLLSSELLQAAFEIQAGAPRGDAFRRIAERTGVEELRNLSALIVQSERFGTSVARTLRVMADSMRVRRMQQAEQRAATASVKMTLPLVLCIFPTLLIIIIGPAILKMTKILTGIGD